MAACKHGAVPGMCALCRKEEKAASEKPKPAPTKKKK